MMMALSNRATTVPSTALLLLLLAVAFSSRWTVQGLVSLSLQRHRMPQQAFFRRQSLVVLRAQDEENEATSTESNELAEEEYEEQEDPEIEALKEEIADSEKKLKEKKRQLMNLSDRADDFSKEGYARKVAEMENMRRARSVSFNQFVHPCKMPTTDNTHDLPPPFTLRCSTHPADHRPWQQSWENSCLY